MRLTSSLWVSALVRQCGIAGAAGFVVKHGADEAGAIFVVVDWLNGQADLYGPAPQFAFDTDHPDGRLFERVLDKVDAAIVEERLSRERDFDPDLWIVTVEDKQGRSFVETE